MFKPIKRDCGAGKRSMEIHKATGCASARLHCDGQKEMRNETGSRYLCCRGGWRQDAPLRSEEHTSELQSLMRISYAVFCLKKKNNIESYKLKYKCQKQYIVHQNDSK